MDILTLYNLKVPYYGHSTRVPEVHILMNKYKKQLKICKSRDGRIKQYTNKSSRNNETLAI